MQIAGSKQKIELCPNLQKLSFFASFWFILSYLFRQGFLDYSRFILFFEERRDSNFVLHQLVRHRFGRVD
jgi:hypothetical protein